MTRKLKTALAAAGISIAAVSLSACGASSGGDASAIGVEHAHYVAGDGSLVRQVLGDKGISA